MFKNVYVIFGSVISKIYITMHTIDFKWQLWYKSISWMMMEQWERDIRRTKKSINFINQEKLVYYI